MMPLGDPLDDAASGLRGFEEALASATEALDGIGGDTSAGIPGVVSGGAAGGRGGRGGILGGRKKGGIKGKLKGFAQKAALDAADDFLTGALGTGSAGVGAGTAARGALGLAASIPILGAFGFKQTEKTLGRSEARVGGALSDLARQGLVVTDEMIQRDLDVVIAQERRATEVEARVKGATGDLARIGEAAPAALSGGIQELVSLVEDIANSIKGALGGASA